jgi:demethylmenaquinone methyltransferase/2-methoxy-6-polyprenyl-1,4-benzoquinol methylase
MFTAIARRYDLNNRVHSFGRDQSWRRRAVALARVRPTDAVLDVACGTGDLTEAFAAAGPASVVGLDFTAAMLELARVKARRLSRPADGRAPTYVQGDAMALPFAAESFDVVSIAFGIRNVLDPPTALGEFRRVLRPGGRLVVLEFGEPANPLLRAYRYLPRSIGTFLPRDELAAAIGRAGFAGVSQHPFTFGVCVAYLAQPAA